MTLIFTLMTIVAATAHSDESTCKDVLKKCDLALHAQIEVNKTQEEIIQDQIKLITTQKSQISEESLWKPIAIGGIVVIGVETLILILRR